MAYITYNITIFSVFEDDFDNIIEHVKFEPFLVTFLLICYVMYHNITRLTCKQQQIPYQIA